MSRDYVLQPFQSPVELQIDYAKEINEQQHEAVRDVDVYIGQPCLTCEEGFAVRRQIPHPFVLDENIDDLGILLRAKAGLAMDVVNLKIGKLGGLTKIKQVRDLCVSMGIGMTLENSWGGDIARAAIAHLAHSTPTEFLFSTTDFNSYVSRAPDARTEWWTTVVRPTRRQVAAENGQVGRSIRTNMIDPDKPDPGSSSLLSRSPFRHRESPMRFRVEALVGTGVATPIAANPSVEFSDSGANRAVCLSHKKANPVVCSSRPSS